MDTFEQIKNTMKSFEGRINKLGNDPNIDLQTFCDRTSSLEHECFESIKRILNGSEREHHVSSVMIAKEHGLIPPEPKYLTLKETLDFLGFDSQYEKLCKGWATNIWVRTTAEPDWTYKRLEVKEREDGVPELVISIPFGIKGL